MSSRSSPKKHHQIPSNPKNIIPLIPKKNHTIPSNPQLVFVEVSGREQRHGRTDAAGRIGDLPRDVAPWKIGKSQWKVMGIHEDFMRIL
jgi:hypothetical protein